VQQGPSTGAEPDPAATVDSATFIEQYAWVIQGLIVLVGVTVLYRVYKSLFGRITESSAPAYTALPQSDNDVEMAVQPHYLSESSDQHHAVPHQHQAHDSRTGETWEEWDDDENSSLNDPVQSTERSDIDRAIRLSLEEERRIAAVAQPQQQLVATTAVVGRAAGENVSDGSNNNTGNGSGKGDSGRLSTTMSIPGRRIDDISQQNQSESVRHQEQRQWESEQPVQQRVQRTSNSSTMEALQQQQNRDVIATSVSSNASRLGITLNKNTTQSRTSKSLTASAAEVDLFAVSWML
jgi:hypothetical protein